MLLYGKVLFIQRRPGRRGEIFSLLKFQTMKAGTDSDESRVTFLGNILRKLAIDELPQIINILKGEMSFVGPRPLLIEYLSIYNEKHIRRHQAHPGITGLAQIRGRIIENWIEKLDADVFYVDHISFKLDLYIVFNTVKLLFIRAGRKKEFIEGKFHGYES